MMQGRLQNPLNKTLNIVKDQNATVGLNKIMGTEAEPVLENYSLEETTVQKVEEFSRPQNGIKDLVTMLDSDHVIQKAIMG